MALKKPEILCEPPGRPGAPPRWSPGSKSAGGTSLSNTSLVWFTICRGVLTEIYYPRIDLPCTRDLFSIVTGPDGFYSDERLDATHTVKWIAEGVPGWNIESTCNQQRYRFEKTIITDDRFHCVLQKTRFTALRGRVSDYRLHIYINPHVAGQGQGNIGWIGEYKQQPFLFARRGDVALAVGCTNELPIASAGFVGKSDGVSQLEEQGYLSETFVRAEDGNVGLIAEVRLERDEFTLAVGFGLGAHEAAHNALGSLQRDFAESQARYVRRWQAWHQSLLRLDSTPSPGRDLYRISASTLLSHTNKAISGAVASMSIPWGDHRGDDTLMEGAYHLIWPRDLVQQGGGMLAIGAYENVAAVIEYLATTQEADGHWPQNMWVSGQPFWDGVQIDETAQPILLTDLALREGALQDQDRERLWPMIRRAAGYVACYGASTEQDRWEELPGYNSYTLATAISALRVAADWADALGETGVAAYFRETADARDACIEGWLYVQGTELAKQLDIDGYYVRIMPPECIEPSHPGQQAMRLLGIPLGAGGLPAAEVVGVDALALVRFGIRAADDPRILNTLAAIDACLKVEASQGPVWRRFRGDQFGEDEDGGPYQSTRKGKGRAWPLLIGERAHYEIARGDLARASQLAAVMADFATDTGMLPEQVWDSADVPEKGLFLGKPTGSAMPLLWAHAEYLKLRRSLRDAKVFDRPLAVSVPKTNKTRADALAVWRPDHRCPTIPNGTALRIEVPVEMHVQWQITKSDIRSENYDSKLFFNNRIFDIPPAALPAGAEVRLVISPMRDGLASQTQHSVAVQ